MIMVSGGMVVYIYVIIFGVLLVGFVFSFGGVLLGMFMVGGMFNFIVIIIDSSIGGGLYIGSCVYLLVVNVFMLVIILVLGSFSVLVGVVYS